MNAMSTTCTCCSVKLFIKKVIESESESEYLFNTQHTTSLKKKKRKKNYSENES